MLTFAKNAVVSSRFPEMESSFIMQTVVIYGSLAHDKMKHKLLVKFPAKQTYRSSEFLTVWCEKEKLLYIL